MQSKVRQAVAPHSTQQPPRIRRSFSFSACAHKADLLFPSYTMPSQPEQQQMLKKKRVLNHYGGTKATPVLAPMCAYPQKLVATTGGLVLTIRAKNQGVMTSAKDPRGRRNSANTNPKAVLQRTASTFNGVYNPTTGGAYVWYYQNGWAYSWQNHDYDLWNSCPAPPPPGASDVASLHACLEWWNLRETRTRMGMYVSKVYLGIPTLISVQKSFIP